MRFIGYLVMLATLMVTPRQLLAQSSYDRDEAIRRAGEKLEQYDQQQREAAKRRADERERAERAANMSPEQKTGQIIFFGGIALAFFYFTLIRPIARTVREIASEREPEKRARHQKQQLAQARADFLSLLNELLSRGIPAEILESRCYAEWQLKFKISGDRLKMDDYMVRRAGRLAPEIRSYFRRLGVTN